MAPAATRIRKLRAACDRCYAIKERCERANTSSACSRCRRLDHACLTIRPVRPSGRRPQHDNPPVPQQTTFNKSGSTAPSPSDAGSWIHDLAGLEAQEKEQLMFLLEQPRALQHCVVSRNFEDAEQRSFSSALPAALPVLKDAYIAYAGILQSLIPGCTTEASDKDSLLHAASAMVSLRTLSVANSDDAELCLALGSTLAIFVYAAIGIGVSDICQHCLSITRPFVGMATDPETESRITFLVLLDTMDGMVHRRKSALRFEPPATETVDRRLGLCLSLLPYYHDLCDISHSLNSATDVGAIFLLQKQLEGIHSFVDAWHPLPPKHFVQRFGSVEIIHFLAQARVYRLAALLLTHRLRFLFGEEDSQADIWSREVMAELDLARRVTQQPIRFVTMPFVVAAIEIRDPGARLKAIGDVDEYVDQFTPAVQNATKTFLARIWSERDQRLIESWFASAHKPCIILESIELSLSG